MDSNPMVAGLLGWIPGVGAMYNEQYDKGLAHLAVFVLLVLLTKIFGAFGIFIAGWEFYMAIEAYHTARARRDGTPLPNPFGFNDIGERMGFRNAANRRAGYGNGNYAGGRGAGTAPEPQPYTEAYQQAGAPSAPQPGGPAAGGTPAPGPTPWGAPTDGFGANASSTPNPQTIYEQAHGTAFSPGQAQTQGYSQPYSPPFQTVSSSAAQPGQPSTSSSAFAAGYTPVNYTTAPIPGASAGAAGGYAAAGVAACAARGTRFPAGAVWLIGLGTLFLLSTTGIFRGSFDGLVGIGLVGLGAWNFLRCFLHPPASLSGADQKLPRFVRALHSSVWVTLVGVLILLNSTHILGWGHSWPLFLITGGVMALLSRIAASHRYAAATPFPGPDPLAWPPDPGSAAPSPAAGSPAASPAPSNGDWNQPGTTASDSAATTAARAEPYAPEGGR
jgi:TM2 domain-containing membrane protein YozV